MIATVVGHLQTGEPMNIKSAATSKAGIGVIAGVVGLVIGAASAGSSSTSTQAASDSTPAPTVTVTAPGEAGATVTATATATEVATETVTAAPAGPEAAFSDGVWLVGEDIKPGRYRVTAPISGEQCYWKIGKPGSDDIIQNDLVSGGRPTVVLKAGQEFTSQRCGDWALAK